MNLRYFFWRYRAPFATAYLTVLTGIVCATCWYCYAMPASVDAGLTVIARHVLYQRTFRPVEQARQDFEAGQFDRAATRLKQFIDQHSDVQTDQMETHAVSDAHELLADVYLVQGRAKKAVKVMDDIAERTPLNYRMWYKKAKMCKAAGDSGGAAKAFRSAFKLALNHPDVANGYLDVLIELGAYDEILWVAENFESAVRRGLPSAHVKIGVARGASQRRALQMAGIDVAHGDYGLKLRRFRLKRGQRQTIAVGEDALAQNPLANGKFYVEVDFENIYDGLTIDALSYWTRDGKWHAYELSDGELGTLHRPQSGAEYITEIRTDIGAADVVRFEIVYSCGEPALSTDALAIIDKARANREAKGTDS